MDRKKTRIGTIMLMLGVAISGNAQSGVTYNHDSSKKNQITVMEIGSGSLSPELYYQLLHSSYKKSAASKNKLGFRTTVGIGTYNQVEYAEAIDSALTKRAEIEVLNMADRQIDLAWKVEGSKINSKMDAFKNNIDRILPVGDPSVTSSDGRNTIMSMRQPSKPPRMPICPMPSARRCICRFTQTWQSRTRRL